jgi:hypothetical protein
LLYLPVLRYFPLLIINFYSNEEMKEDWESSVSVCLCEIWTVAGQLVVKNRSVDFQWLKYKIE